MRNMTVILQVSAGSLPTPRPPVSLYKIFQICFHQNIVEAYRVAGISACVALMAKRLAIGGQTRLHSLKSVGRIKS